MVDAEIVGREIIASVCPSLTELVGIWDYVGYTQDERADHLKSIVQHIQHALDDMIAQENALRLDMERRIESMRREVAELSHQLRLPAYLPERGLTSSELMSNLEQKADELRQTKRNRCEQYEQLRSRVLRLSELLSEPAELSLRRVANFPMLTPSTPTNASGEKSSTGALLQNGNMEANEYERIPDEREIKALTEVHDELNALYAPLAEQHAALREDIGRIALDILYEPQTDREKEILKAVGLNQLCSRPNPSATPGVVRKLIDARNSSDTNGSEKENTEDQPADPYEPIVDEETLKWLTEWRLRLVKEKARLVGTCEELRSYLSTMWRRLDKPEAERKAFLDKHAGYQPETLDALQEEVDRCQQIKWEKLDVYLNKLTTEALSLAKKCCVDESIIQLPADQDSGDPEAMANHLETILEQMTQTYAQYRPIYDSIAAYEDLWQTLQDVELRLKDPAIFSNRGGILLKTEKEKKRLVKEVQRAEQDALSAIEQYEAKNNTTFQLSDGRSFKQYISDRWSNNSSNSKSSREPSRARRSVVPAPVNPRPSSAHLSNPPGAPT